MEPLEVTVVGAGGIGTSVAHAFAELGDAVLVIDNDPAALRAAEVNIRRTHLARLLRGATNRSVSETLDRIRYSTELADSSGSDLVIENVTENVQTKMAVHREISHVAFSGRPIIAVNSSAIPIRTVQREYSDSSSVIGLHLMNPVIETASAEVVRSQQTGADTERQLLTILHDRRFLTVVINDGAGYVINRALMPFINEAIGSVRRGSASAAEVDRLFVNSLKHQQGPLALADLIGLDTILNTLEVLETLTGDVKFAPDALLREMVEARQLGRKTGTGFFEYGRANGVSH